MACSMCAISTELGRTRVRFASRWSAASVRRRPLVGQASRPNRERIFGQPLPKASGPRTLGNSINVRSPSTRRRGVPRRGDVLRSALTPSRGCQVSSPKSESIRAKRFGDVWTVIATADYVPIDCCVITAPVFAPGPLLMRTRAGSCAGVRITVNCAHAWASRKSAAASMSAQDGLTCC